MISDFVKEVCSGGIDIIRHTEKAVKELEKINNNFHYLSVFEPKHIFSQAEELSKRIKKDKFRGKLAGIFVSLKDCISVKAMTTSACSKILSGYRPLYNATVAERIINEGGIIIGKTVQDEFGFGSFCVNVGNGKIPFNPFDTERCCGGSSGGAAGLTRKFNFPHIAVAESTGGSIAAPAGFCGVYGLTPTYGLVSRYGLLDYASSLDKIGVMTKTADGLHLGMSAVSGFDEKDSTSIKINDNEREGILALKPVKKIGIVSESLSGIDTGVNACMEKLIKKLESNGIKCGYISLPLNFKYSLAAYYLVAVSEASTNLARYCGLRYGYTENISGDYNRFFSDVRSRGFGKEAKRRILLGTFARMAGYRNAYYMKALQVRTLLISEYRKIFGDFDLVLTPTMPLIAPKFDEIERLTPAQQYMMDVMTTGPNLAGLPHISVPVGMHNGLPVGAMFTAPHLCEGSLIGIASMIDNMNLVKNE